MLNLDHWTKDQVRSEMLKMRRMGNHSYNASLCNGLDSLINFIIATADCQFGVAKSIMNNLATSVDLSLFCSIQRFDNRKSIRALASLAGDEVGFDSVCNAINRSLTSHISKIGFFCPMKYEPPIFRSIERRMRLDGAVFLPVIDGSRMFFAKTPVLNEDQFSEAEKPELCSNIDILPTNFSSNIANLLEGSCFRGLMQLIMSDQTVCTNLLDIVILPGLCFGIDGHRIGYGRGFYDKFLDAHRNCIKIGVCHDDALFESIPCCDHDVAVDWIVTPTRIICIHNIATDSADVNCGQ